MCYDDGNDSFLGKGAFGMKGFSVCGLVLGIIAAVCGACAVVFSALGLRR